MSPNNTSVHSKSTRVCYHVYPDFGCIFWFVLMLLCPPPPIMVRFGFSPHGKQRKCCTTNHLTALEELVVLANPKADRVAPLGQQE